MKTEGVTFYFRYQPFKITMIIILWSIDPLLGKDLETNNEYSRYYAIGA
jgi:hypothetical protein